MPAGEDAGTIPPMGLGQRREQYSLARRSSGVSNDTPRWKRIRSKCGQSTFEHVADFWLGVKLPEGVGVVAYFKNPVLPRFCIDGHTAGNNSRSRALPLAATGAPRRPAAATGSHGFGLAHERRLSSSLFLLLPTRVYGGEHFRRRHRQFGQPHADGALDRVGDGCHRRANVDFGGTSGAIRMTGIWHLHNDRLDLKPILWRQVLPRLYVLP
jgi:hypothetical protein